MTYELEWMDTPNGRRYRHWNTVSDTYAHDEVDLDGAAAVLAGRYSIDADKARELVLHRASITPPVEAWQKVAFCGTCGGQWYDRPVECCGKIWEPQ